MKKLKITLAVALFSLFATNLSNAQEAKPSPENRKAEMMNQMKLVKEKLGLTKDQEPKFKEISKKYGEKMKDLKNAEGERKDKLNQFRELNEAKNLEMKALLNSEQFKIYTEIQDERKAMNKAKRAERQEIKK